jgi:DNA-binding transcriptional LysR family regulator
VKRGHRLQALTPNGDVVLQRSRRILADCEAMRSQLGEQPEGSPVACAFSPEARKANFDLVEVIKAIAERKGATPAQIAISWLLAQKSWIVPIPHDQASSPGGKPWSGRRRTYSRRPQRDQH